MRTIDIGEKRTVSYEFPGDYELIRMNLISAPILTNSNKFYNKTYSLQFVYTNFSIYEDLYSNCLSGYVSILDANSILTEFPIIGDELLEIMFRSSSTEVSIHAIFRVIGISEIESINDLTKTYTLLFTSPVSIKSEKQHLQRILKI